MKYNALVQEKADLIGEAKAIFEVASAEERDLSDSERERDDAIHVRLEQVTSDITRWDRQRSAEADLPDLRHFEETPSLEIAKDMPFPTFGEQLKAIYNAGVGQGVDPRLLQVGAAVGAGSAVGADGGFLIQPTFANGIFKRMYDVGSILSRVRRLPLDADSDSMVLKAIDETSRATGSRFGGVQGYWVDEGTAPTASNPKFHKVELKLRKLAALGYATDELLSNASALESIMTEAFGDELVWLVENAIVNGTGAGQPQGILNAAATVSITKETNQEATTIVTRNLSNMWARMWARSRSNAVWLINQDVEPELDELALPVGTGALEPRFVRYGPDGILQIKGRPVLPVEYCATLGTVGDIMLVDLSQYLTIDNGGVQHAQSMHVRFTTDEMAFRATFRVDGQPLWHSALTPANGTNTLTPFLSLATRS